MTPEQRLLSDIADCDIAFELAEHAAVFTVEESDAVNRTISGAHTKNLFLKDANSQFWLVTVAAEARVDLKQLPHAIGSKRLSFGKAEDMERLLGVTPGSVTPLAAINDAEQQVVVVLDHHLMAASTLNVHPLRNTATISMAPADVVRLLKHWHHDPLIAPIPYVA
jgi:Ala-tRNA(Pro) deacylase